MEKYNLGLAGIVSENSMKLIDIPIELKENSVIVFLFYSPYGIKLGSIFNYLKIKDTNYKINASLDYVTQQFNKPFDEIPHGWKTICVFNVNEGLDVFKKLPIINEWSENKDYIEFGFEE